MEYQAGLFSYKPMRSLAGFFQKFLSEASIIFQFF
jgi:hypothetical protein